LLCNGELNACWYACQKHAAFSCVHLQWLWHSWWPQYACNRCGCVRLDSCRFSGMLEDMSALPSLDWLDLSDNELTGPLPAFPLAVRCADP
jgi:hypothetical protein